MTEAGRQRLAQRFRDLARWTAWAGDGLGRLKWQMHAATALRRWWQIATNQTGRTWVEVDEPPRGPRIIGGPDDDWADGRWEVIAQWPPLEDEPPARSSMMAG